MARGGARSRTGSRSSGCRAWARTRRSSSSTPAAWTSARPRVPLPCSAKVNGNPIETVWIYSKPEWTALVTRPDTGIAKVEDLKGKRIAVTKGTDPYIFLLRALDEHGLERRATSSLVLLQHDQGRAGARARRRRRLGRPRPDDGRCRAVAGLPPLLSRRRRQQLRRAQRARGVRGGASRDRARRCWRSTSAAGQWALANPGELAKLLAGVAKLPEPVAAQQLGRTAVRRSAARAMPSARRSSRRARPCRAAAIIKPDVDVAATVDGLLQPSFAATIVDRAMSTALEQLQAPATAASASAQAVPGARLLRHPAVLGLLLPVAVAAVWELAARAGLDRGAPAAAALEGGGDAGRAVPHRRARRVIWPRRSGGSPPASRSGSCWRPRSGALTGFSTRARQLLDPTLQALRAIPSIAWVPLFILWFGIFEASKVALIAIGAFFPIYLSLMTGIQGVDRKLVEVGRVYQLGPLGPDPADPDPGRPARLAHRRARRARARLDVRDRGRADGRVRGAGLPAARRPDGRQRRADPGCPGPVRDPGQGHRLPGRLR